MPLETPKAPATNSPNRSALHRAASALARKLRVDIDPIRLGLIWLAAAPGNDGAKELSPLFGNWEAAEWSSLIDTAEREMLLTWVVHRLNQSSLGCPPDVLANANARASLRSRWNRLISMAALDAYERLNAAGVDAVILKGAPLAIHLYGAAERRDVKDVDLLVRPDQALLAARALENAQYVCQVDQRWLDRPAFLRSVREVSFQKLGGALEIDLHWHLSNRWLRSHTNEDALVDRASESLELNKKAIRWFSDADLLLVAKANVRNSHQVETKSAIDCLRCAERLTGTPLLSIDGGAGRAFVDLAAEIELRTLKMAEWMRAAALLGSKAILADICARSDGAVQLTKLEIWRRHFARVRNVRQAAQLVGTAFSPTLADYMQSTTTARLPILTNSLLRKAKRRD